MPRRALVPVTLAPPIRADVADSSFGWDDFGFWSPENVRLLGEMSAETMIAAGWCGRFGDDEWEPDYFARTRAPFGQGFPGLAPPGDTRLPVTVTVTGG